MEGEVWGLSGLKVSNFGNFRVQMRGFDFRWRAPWSSGLGR